MINLSETNMQWIVNFHYVNYLTLFSSRYIIGSLYHVHNEPIRVDCLLFKI